MTVKTYRLWDTDINRLFGTFDNEAEALDLVQTLLSSYGETYADDLALVCEHQDGLYGEPLTGVALVARVKWPTFGLDKPTSHPPRAGASSANTVEKAEQRKVR